MWANLIANPISPAGSSSTQTSHQSPSNVMGFGAYAPPIVNPFHIAHDDPRNTYQNRAWFGENPPNTWHQTDSPSSHYHLSPQTSQYYQPPSNPHHYPQTSSNPHYYPQTSSCPQTSQQYHQTPTIPEEEVEDTNPQTGKQKRTQVRWTDEDAQILAERWVHASQNCVVGNSQMERRFWATVQAEFNALASVKRNANQLSGKWNKIQPDVKQFNAIYNQHNDNRPSGSRDENVLQAARDHFMERHNGRKFIYEKCWIALKEYPKFFYEDGVMKNKRTHQPEDEPVNLDEDDVPNTNSFQDPLTANMQSLFRDDPIRRPPGRAMSKKSQRSSGSSDAASSCRSLKDEAIEKVIQTAEAQQKAIDKLTDVAQKN